MRNIVNFIDRLPMIVKLLLGLVTLPNGGVLVLIISFIIVPMAKRHYDMMDICNTVIDNPTEENVADFINRMSSMGKTQGVWQMMRSVWNAVNSSENISEETKHNLTSAMSAAMYSAANPHSGISPNGAGVPFDTTLQDEMNRQFTQWAMDESMKAVTPFDHGGYLQGDGFNPSDTMAADMARQAESMNNHMNDMNNFNNGGMF